MTIIVNGQPRELPDDASIQTLLAEMQLAPNRVAVELNRRLLKTERYDQPLKANDQVEIVTFVGGG